ncbi:GNAT family N-acetyltransferase [Lysinibacter cavernae]|uniref:Putative acetyltransferase n=1 Tax=Lysinibacter cavernae TaxID=1640652 RepID=A0A7X5TT43_9MICO|nr:GNAT family N-acetyltransferase [Lysinibacter cavernae]NIH52898.1 putative acetyltransferase [Lysinibacter cavernae]
MTSNFLSLPADSTSQQALADQGLRYDTVASDDAAAMRAWLDADMRGFHSATASAALIEHELATITGNRVTGIWDARTAQPEVPVATVSSWPMPLTVAPQQTIDGWAISSVTVSPTHRRRGLARNLLLGELRTAVAHGCAIAMLTVTQATIYGRFGFGPAAFSSAYTVDTQRAVWSGPVPTGALSFVSQEVALDIGPAIKERVRLQTPGEVPVQQLWWKETLGLSPSSPADSHEQLRVVCYSNENGDNDGLVVYRVESSDDHSSATLELVELIAATPAAYAALWRFVLEMDPITVVKATRRAVVEPLTWQVLDSRSVRKTDERDHLWLRILDVERVLASRAYAAAGALVLDVVDPDGFATGTYRLTTDANGTGSVERVDGAAAELRVGIAELSSLLLGGLRAETLASAGRIAELVPGAALAFDRVFASATVPRLSTWF